jgi:hypothetical protein
VSTQQSRAFRAHLAARRLSYATSEDKFYLHEDGVSSQPRIVCTKDHLRIGCAEISRDAWLELSRQWDKFLETEEKVIQS